MFVSDLEAQCNSTFLLQNLKLVGGSFSEFESLQSQIYDILESTNLENKGERDLAESEIESCYSQIEWMPDAFKQILKGKNHLPASKIRPSIFKREGGFLGIDDYRQHFFGSLTLSSLITLFFPEKAKYSVLALNIQKFDRTIDYRQEDFTKTEQSYDLILDPKTNRSIFKYLSVLKPHGSYVTVGGETPSQGYVFKIWVSAPIVDRVKSPIIPFGSQSAAITETLIFS